MTNSFFSETISLQLREDGLEGDIFAQLQSLQHPTARPERAHNTLSTTECSPGFRFFWCLFLTLASFFCEVDNTAKRPVTEFLVGDLNVFSLFLKFSFQFLGVASVAAEVHVTSVRHACPVGFRAFQ